MKYNTKKEATEHFNKLFASKDFNEEFIDEDLKELILENHYYISKNKRFIPIKFRKVPNEFHQMISYKAYQLDVFFEEDNLGWHKISWKKCITPKTPIQEVKSALRRAIDQVIYAFRKTTPNKCIDCNTNGDMNNYLEVHHTIPFEELFKELRNKVSNEDMEYVANLHKVHWAKKETFKLPKESIVVQTFLELHRKSKLIFLCQKCHNKRHNFIRKD